MKKVKNPSKLQESLEDVDGNVYNEKGKSLDTERQDYANAFIFVGSENVFLIRKKTPTWQYGYFNAIGGKVEPWENPQQAVIREVGEETTILDRFRLPTNWNKFAVTAYPNRAVVHWFYNVIDARYFSDSEDARTTSKTAESLELVSLSGLRDMKLLDDVYAMVHMALYHRRCVSLGQTFVMENRLEKL